MAHHQTLVTRYMKYGPQYRFGFDQKLSTIYFKMAIVIMEKNMINPEILLYPAFGPTHSLKAVT